MEERKPAQAIRYAGSPAVSRAGEQVFAFHLYRYLSPWLREMGCDCALVALGFEKSDADLGAYRIDAAGGQRVQTGWSYRDLADSWRFSNGCLMWEGADGVPVAFEVMAVLDEETGQGGGSEEPLGFVLLRREEQSNQVLLERLAACVLEAIRVARRNSARLFFDEEKDRGVKELLYTLMDRLPEWTGCDHSAAVLLTHNLDAMTLQPTSEETFNVLAERVFFGSQESQAVRLVGMTLAADSKKESLVDDALERHKKDPDQAFFLYRRSESGGWTVPGEEQELSHWHGLKERAQEELALLLPLVHRERGERDLLGFLTLCYGQGFVLPPSVSAGLKEIGKELARLLRRSPLYTLSVRKMWVVRKVRDAVEKSVVHAESEGVEVEALIREVTDFVADQVDVPSVAIGYVKGAPGERRLRYVHPRGWTRFDVAELAVDVGPEERVDSGVSALAIRLGCPVVLAGGHGTGADQEFRNFLWVDEERQTIFDARGTRHSEAELRQRCSRLRDYYMPARETAYATLAYPIVFADQVLGVLTLEVEKHTDWLWWTGFGGHLFWEMIAREVGLALFASRKRS